MHEPAYLLTCPSPTRLPPTNEPCWLGYTSGLSASPHTAHTSWSLTISTPSAMHFVSGCYCTSNTVQAPTSASNLSPTYHTLGYLTYRPNPYISCPPLSPRGSDFSSTLHTCTPTYLLTYPGPTLLISTNEPRCLTNTSSSPSSHHTAHTSWHLTISVSSTSHIQRY